MKKLFIASAIILASMSPVFADKIDITKMGFLTQDEVVIKVYSAVPDSVVTIVDKSTLVFQSPTNVNDLVIFFNDIGCAVESEVVPKVSH